MSTIFKLNSRDFLDSFISAVIVAVVVALAGVVQTPGFSVFTAPWKEILSSMFNVGVVTFIGILAKSFGTSSNGKFMGRI